MGTTLGLLTLPSDTVIRRIGETIRLRPARHSIPKGKDKMYWFGVELPRVRYEGVLHGSTALDYLEGLKEMFRNVELDYPLYLKLDKNYFFLVESMSWERLPGRRNEFRFDISIIRYGSRGEKQRGYNVESVAVETNDWSL